MITRQRIEEALRSYRPRFSLGQRFETKGRSNFLHFIKKVKGENGSVYVMKLPKAFTDIMCYLRIAVFHLLGDNAIVYAPFSLRVKNEQKKFRILNEKGVPSIPLAGIKTGDVLVTEFVRGANLKDLFRYGDISFEEKLKFLEKGCRRLEDIHAYFSHGDAQVRNVLVSDDNETRWLDFDYIGNPEVPLIKRKARDLAFFIFSAAKHLGEPDIVVRVILNAYKDMEVKKTAASLSVYQSIAYNIFLNFLNPFMCMRVKKALRQAIGG